MAAQPHVPQPDKQPSTTPKTEDSSVDDALSESFPASDPPSFTPRRAGRDDKKAPLTDSDAAPDTGRERAPEKPLKH